jgi:3',5'-cyclic AMP phosphodiesterase CpdA
MITILLSDPDGLKAETFTFVQVCDTQLGVGGYQHDVESFGLAVKQINFLKPDFVVICGDLVSQPDDQSFTDFNRIKNELVVPCYCVVGNHDVGNKPTYASLERYRKVIGKDYYSFEHKGYTFVMVNTQLWKAPLKNELKKHDLWFEQTLAAASKKKSPIFLVGHYPLYLRSPKEKEKYYNLPRKRRNKLLTLLKQNGVVAVLTGHVHTIIVNDYKGIQLVTGETTSKNLYGRPLGFRFWHVSPTLIKHEFIPLIYKDAKQKTTVDKNKSRP